MDNEQLAGLINALIMLHQTGGVVRPNSELAKIEFTPEEGLCCYYRGEVRAVQVQGVLVGFDPAEEGGDQTIMEIFDEDTGEKLH